MIYRKYRFIQWSENVATLIILYYFLIYYIILFTEKWKAAFVPCTINDGFNILNYFAVRKLYGALFINKFLES